jgi:hypothetical protein
VEKRGAVRLEWDARCGSSVLESAAARRGNIADVLLDKEGGDMTETLTTEELRQHELVILRRLRGGPLTEFELASEVSDHSGYGREDAADRIGRWLEELQRSGLVWCGKLYNSEGQYIHAAALTRRGKELVG